MRKRSANQVSTHVETALQALSSLQEGDTRPRTLHCLRTSLRRIEAYLEVIGDDRAADSIGQAVSRSSRLRAWQVFKQYLRKAQAPRENFRQATRCIRKRQAKLIRKQTYRKIERQLKALKIRTSSLQEDWLASRLSTLRRIHAEALRALHASVLVDPRRKLLHQTRLRIKTIRYQEEWALGRPFAKPALVRQLKDIQGVLGEYEDLAQFRRWACDLDPGLRSRIKKDWRKARERARGIVDQLDEVIEGLAPQRLWLVGMRSPKRTHKRGSDISLGRSA
jgi:CHAD domain-containing protein